MSIRMNVKVEGIGRVTERVVSKRKALEGCQLEAARAMAEEPRKWLIEEMRQPKSGIWWPTLPHPSSAEGEVPASQSGAMESSIAIKPTARNNVTLSVGEGLARNYPAMLEMGYALPNGTYVQRPFIRPALEATKEKSRAAALAIIRRAAT